MIEIGRNDHENCDACVGERDPGIDGFSYTWSGQGRFLGELMFEIISKSVGRIPCKGLGEEHSPQRE